MSEQPAEESEAEVAGDTETNEARPGILRRWLTGTVGASNWLWLSGVIIALDQWTKWLVVENFERYQRMELWSFLDITRLHNTGAAFSLLSDAGGWQRWFFISLGLVVSAVIMVWLRRLPRRGRTLLAMALALIIGGALGNVIDRAVYGYVVDFIHVHHQYLAWAFEGGYFPAFNVADSAITVGAIILILDSLLHRE